MSKKVECYFTHAKQECLITWIWLAWNALAKKKRTRTHVILNICFCAFKTQEFATSHHSHHWNPIAQKVKVFTIKVGSLIDIQFPDGVLDKSTTTNKVSLSYSYLFPECHFSTLFVTFVRAVKGTGILTREIFQRRDSYHQHIPLEYLSRFSLVVKYKKMKWSVYFLRYDIPRNSIFYTVWKFYTNRIFFI